MSLLGRRLWGWACSLRRSASLALINGLPFDEPSEGAIVEGFAARLEAVEI